MLFLRKNITKCWTRQNNNVRLLEWSLGQHLTPRSPNGSTSDVQGRDGPARIRRLQGEQGSLSLQLLQSRSLVPPPLAWGLNAFPYQSLSNGIEAKCRHGVLQLVSKRPALSYQWCGSKQKAPQEVWLSIVINRNNSYRALSGRSERHVKYAKSNTQRQIHKVNYTGLIAWFPRGADARQCWHHGTEYPLVRFPGSPGWGTWLKYPHTVVTLLHLLLAWLF